MVEESENLDLNGAPPRKKIKARQLLFFDREKES
jgi:hypothetical protein